MPKKDYSVSRFDAAELLDVSLRTLDRYTKTDKISAARRGRSLYFDESELMSFKAEYVVKNQMIQKKRKAKSKAKKQSKPASRQEDGFADVGRAQAREQEDIVADVDIIDPDFAVIRDELLRRSPEESIFKTLYKKAEVELDTLRKQLNTANYRVGQLEAQVKSMVPLLSFKKQKQKLLSLTEEKLKQEQQISALEQQINVERFAKKVYGVFLWFMSALIPLILVLRVVYGI